MNKEKHIKNRSEIVFLYDVENANPNGDPLDEDKPRIDDETEINFVTDVRLKRTVRDYLDDIGENIFIKEEKKKDGTQKTRSKRLSEFLARNKDEFENWKIDLEDVSETSDKKLNEALGDISIANLRKALLKTYTDLRLFGATIAVENSTITEIGPVQFNFGKSLHKVTPTFIRGTTVMPSRKDVEQGTMTEMWVTPYSLIIFHGIINENAAKDTGLTERDVDLLFEGLWNGTKNLLTRSKKGHTPRMLLVVDYKENDFHIGELNKSLKLISEKEDKEIREVNEHYLDVTELIDDLKNNSSRIGGIRYKVNQKLQLFYREEKITPEDFIEQLSSIGDVKALSFKD
ncbi:MAG: type I-B CRISPR-associated protein Cas7/Csh2 [Candidatus Thermoplasmatota archaeon]